MNFDVLEAFFNWWITNRVIDVPRDIETIHFDNNSSRQIIYQNKQFQVQLITMMPNTEIPMHVHPGVDSCEYPVSGDINFYRNGEHFPFDKQLGGLRILPTDVHGGIFGERGGSFLSIQHWLIDKPGFIHEDWEFSDKEETRKNFKVGDQ